MKFVWFVETNPYDASQLNPTPLTETLFKDETRLINVKRIENSITGTAILIDECCHN